MSQRATKHMPHAVTKPTNAGYHNIALLPRESRYDRDLIHNLTQGFTCGFRIQFQSSLPHTIQPRNNPYMLENSSVIDHMIVSELNLGRTAGPFFRSTF